MDWLHEIRQIVVSGGLHNAKITLEEEVEGDSLCVVRIQVVPVYFGLQDNFLGFVGLTKFDDQEGIGDRDEVEIGKISAADE